ncbi:protein aveugle-like isoform X2 [Lineus longissimus]
MDEMPTRIPPNSTSSYNSLNPEGLDPQTPGSKAKQSTIREGSTTSGKKIRMKPVYFWNVNDVNKWMKKCCPVHYNRYGVTFQDNEITGRALLRLNDNKLRRLGIVENTDRDELLHYIHHLRIKFESYEFKNMDQDVKS